MTEETAIPSPRGLKAKVFASASLSIAQFMSKAGLKLVSAVVLTRLLAPEIYGTFAVVLIYRYILEMVSDLGLRALVMTHEEKPDAAFIRTIWTVDVLRGVTIMVVSGLIALTIWWLNGHGSFAADSAYAAPELPAALAALGLAAFLGTFHSANRYMYEREMVFGRVTVMMVGAGVINLVVTIALAIWLRSIWALVWGAVAQSLFMVIYSNLAFSGPRMGFLLDRTALGAIIARGKWIMGHSTLTALTVAADRLVLGFVMSSTVFGYYHIARQFLDLLRSFLNSVHFQMGVQVFTRILTEERAAFLRKYYTYRMIFDAIAGTTAGGLMVAAPLAVEILFDPRYADAAPMAQILALGLIPTGALILREAWMAKREFRPMTLLKGLSTIAIWLGLAVAIQMQSVTAALVVIALHNLPEAMVLTWMGYRRGWVLPWRELMPLAFITLGAGLGWVLLFAVELIG